MDNDNVKWPVDFSELQSLDSAFKCGICYDYMKTSMITLCSHTYCSLCIRKFLLYSTKCPTCFVETRESDLRNNRPLDNIIMLYVQVRNKLLRALRVAEAASRGGAVVNSPAPSCAGTVKSEAPGPSKQDRTPSARTALFSQSCQREEEVVAGEDTGADTVDCKVPLMFTSSRPCSSRSKPAAAQEVAPCPVCQVDIPSRNINLHLDACLQRSNQPPEEPKAVSEKQREPLPKRLYHLMNDKILKQELRSYGLSLQGDRKAWLNRIRRFSVLYNSETDVDNPRSVSSLVQQLEREEREEKRKDNPLFKSLSQKVDRYSNPDAITKANKQYIEDNKDSFKRLILEMKAREGRNIKPTKPVRVLESDDEADGLRLVGGGPASHYPLPSSAPADDALPPAAAAGSSVLGAADPPPSSLPETEQLLSETDDSSLDSLFEFTPGRAGGPRERRSAKTRGSEPCEDSASAVSHHCLPDTHLYQSVFDDEKSEGEAECGSDGPGQSTPPLSVRRRTKGKRTPSSALPRSNGPEPSTPPNSQCRKAEDRQTPTTVHSGTNGSCASTPPVFDSQCWNGDEEQTPTSGRSVRTKRKLPMPASKSPPTLRPRRQVKKPKSFS